MTGGGKYNKEAKQLRYKLKAFGVILVVYRGIKGDGFEVQMPPSVAHRIPTVLREIATAMEADLNKLTQTENPKGN